MQKSFPITEIVPDQDKHIVVSSSRSAVGPSLGTVLAFIFIEFLALRPMKGKCFEMLREAGHESLSTVWTNYYTNIS
jgi:hypothetical protein